jgi:hypothetical protein
MGKQTSVTWPDLINQRVRTAVGELHDHVFGESRDGATISCRRVPSDSSRHVQRLLLFSYADRCKTELCTTMVKDPMLSQQPGGGDASLTMDNEVGATIQLWRAPNRIWPAFPTVAVVRTVSRLGRGRAKRRSPAIGEVSVFLDGSKMGAISPKQIKVYQVSRGEHSLSLHFLGGLRRSRKLYVPLAEGEEKQFVCRLNAIAWPSIRPATPEDVTEMERWKSPSVDPSDLPKDDSR